MIEILAISCAYIIGAIPSGYLIARYRGISDIRSMGSGNIGATNVARVLGLKYFFLVFLCDGIKSYGVIRVLQLVGYHESFIIGAAVALLIGNAFSIFLQFKGGKGIATSFGIMLAIEPMLTCIIGGIWLCALFVTKTVGIASIIGLCALPFVAWGLISDLFFFSFIIFVTILGLWLHRDNMKIYMLSIKNF